MIRGTFLGLEISKTGLFAARAGLDTVGHNIANANTEGYSRQRISLRSSFPLAFPGPFITLRPGMVGTGVEVTSIARIRNAFVEAQIHREGGGEFMFEAMHNSYIRVEDIFNEPSESGVNVLMENFFNAWEDLSTDPESTALRTTLREAAVSFTVEVNEIDFRINLEISNLNEQIVTKVNELNTLASQVATLNDQIMRAETALSKKILANDLKDRRDLLIENISQIVNARVIKNRNGGISVLVQGHPIVENEYHHEIGLRPSVSNPTNYEVVFEASQIPLAINSGELAGLLQMRDVEIPAIRDQFAQLITAFTNQVNEVHSLGYGLDGNKGRPFFIDDHQKQVVGSIPLPTDITLDSTLDELGITAGDFFVQGQRIVIENTEVQPGQAITLRQLLERIEDPSIDIRAELDTSLGFPRILISQYNPVSKDTPLVIKDGSSNFFETVGLDPSKVEDLDSDPLYRNSLYNMRVNSTILADLDTIAAASDDGEGFPGPGDNRTALAIADLKNDSSAVFETTFSEFHQSTIARLGSASQTIERNFRSQTLVVEQLENRRQSISGVNLDEEAVQLIRFQKAFEASARMMTVIDEVLNHIINRMGIVGR